MAIDVSSRRESYEQGALLEATCPASPLELFETWFAEALASDLPEPYAMSVATADASGQPSVRTVLLREVTRAGAFRFYTNYLSEKGLALATNPVAELLFFWPTLERQVRVRGAVRCCPTEDSAAYFASRPHGSQLAAWVSQPQSGVVASRDALHGALDDLRAQYPEGSTVPRPDFWGGYDVWPTRVEFWQGGPNRLHDRVVYLQDTASDPAQSGHVSSTETVGTETRATWSMQRLNP